MSTSEELVELDGVLAVSLVRWAVDVNEKSSVPGSILSKSGEELLGVSGDSGKAVFSLVEGSMTSL